MVGTHAGDMIGEIALAIEMGADAIDIGKTIHPHPTLGESIGMAAEVAHGSCTDVPPARKQLVMAFGIAESIPKGTGQWTAQLSEQIHSQQLPYGVRYETTEFFMCWSFSNEMAWFIISYALRCYKRKRAS